MKQLVIMPGGFHPFHAGHLALYQSALAAFPGADVKVAATNDTSARPFPFKLKEKLAQLAGVPPGDFYQVKSPFQALEITQKYNPADTQLIFVRSEKDADKPPRPGSIKKDGTPGYLQPISNQMAPMTQHAYMAYLPTVTFGPGMRSATEIRTAWPSLNERQRTALVMSLYPNTQKNTKLANTVVRMLDTAMGTEVAEDLSRRGFLKGAGAAATMAAAGPEIATLVNGFAEKAGGLNGIQALKAMLKVATADELYNMYEYQADSGILADAITDSDMVALDRAGYDNWSEFEEHCDENGVDADDEFKRLTRKPLTVILVQDILEKIDNTWSLEDYFEQYPDALKIINPFENGSISMPTMRQLAKIDTAAKGASLPTPIVAMANAVAGLVRQIFKSNGQSLAAPQQVAQTSRAAPALPAPTRPEFDMTPDLKQKEKVPMRRKDNDQESKRSYVAVRHQPASDLRSDEVEWNIVDNRGEFVRNFWTSNDQADADRVMNGMIRYMTALAPESGLAKRGPFRAVRASVPVQRKGDDEMQGVDEQVTRQMSQCGLRASYQSKYNQPMMEDYLDEARS